MAAVTDYFTLLPQEVIKIILLKSNFKDLIQLTLTSKKLRIVAYKIILRTTYILMSKNPVCMLFHDKFSFLTKNLDLSDEIIRQSKMFNDNLTNHGYAICVGVDNEHVIKYPDHLTKPQVEGFNYSEMYKIQLKMYGDDCYVHETTYFMIIKAFL